MSKPVQFLGAVILLLTACGNPSHEVGKQPQNGPLSTKVEFASVRDAIFTPHCVGCHGQYSTYGGVKRELPAIWSAVESDRMPKNRPPLSAALKESLKKWIDAGAPEMEDGGSEIPEFELAAEWNSIYGNIIAPKCLVCHNPNGQAKFLDLSTRQSIYDARNRVFATGKKLLDLDNAANSYLLDVINDPVEPMPPPQTNIPRLNTAEIETLTKWIELGLP